MALFIALGLAVPVILSGVIFREQKIVMFAALIMGGVGIVSGNPKYIIVDLVAVGVGYFVGIQFSQKKSLW